MRVTAAPSAGSPAYRNEIGADHVIGAAGLIFGPLIVREVGGVPDDHIVAVDELTLDEPVQA